MQPIESSFHVDAGSSRAKLMVIFTIKVEVGVPDNFDREKAQRNQSKDMVCNYRFEFPELLKLTGVQFSDLWLGSLFCESKCDLLQQTTF